jgi:hypothetical protein
MVAQFLLKRKYFAVLRAAKGASRGICCPRNENNGLLAFLVPVGKIMCGGAPVNLKVATQESGMWMSCGRRMTR